MSDWEPRPQAQDDLRGRLEAARAVPNSEFRGALRRHLIARDPGYGSRPANLRAMVFAYVAAGLALLAVGVLQASGQL